MAKSAADICNKALSRIGIKAYIDNFDTDGSEEAETAGLYYDDTRDLLLAAYPWPFATLRKTLVVKADELPRDGWSFIFALPDNCLQTRRLYPVGTARGVTAMMQDLYPPNQVLLETANPRSPRADQRIPYEIEKSSTDDTAVLLCDLDVPILFYTAKVSDVAKFHPLFTDALAWYLAAEMAMPLTIDQKREDYARKKFKEVVGTALATLFQGQQQDENPLPEMLAARR
jgi:hypothetical protein